MGDNDNPGGSLVLEVPVPVLQVLDVERSLVWYGRVFGFDADPFPVEPPYSFAILRRDRAEIMLQRADGTARRRSGWTIYLRVSGGQLLDLAARIRQHTTVLRGPERAIYGQVELEVTDPDGHVICVAEPLPEHPEVPRREE